MFSSSLYYIFASLEYNLFRACMSYSMKCGFGMLPVHAASRFRFHFHWDRRHIKHHRWGLKFNCTSEAGCLGVLLQFGFLLFFFLMQVWCNKAAHLFNDFMTNPPFCPSLPFRTSDLWKLLLSPSVIRGAEEHGPAERDRPLSRPFPHVRGCWPAGTLLGAHLCGWALHPSLLFPLPHHSRHQWFAGWLKKETSLMWICRI